MAVSEIRTSRFESIINKHPEWIISLPDGSLFPARAHEIRLNVAGSAVELELPTDFGLTSILPISIDLADDSITIVCNTESDEQTELSLIPRIESGGIQSVLKDARTDRAEAIAKAFDGMKESLRAIRFDFSSDGGRLVTIFCEDRWKRERLVMADVSDSLSPEYLLSSALIRLERASCADKETARGIALVLPRKAARGLVGLRSMLRPKVREAIEIYESEISEDGVRLKNLSDKSIRHRPNLRMKVDLNNVSSHRLSEVEGLVNSLRDLAVDEIDVVNSSAGWTLRYHGLPFLRIRVVGDSTRFWVGVGTRRREVTEKALVDEVNQLIVSLAEHRRHDPPTRRHEYYKLAPEAWLESMLLRNIQRLDPNLVTTPVYNQFKTGQERIDIFAARADGRPVIIEVKVGQDREALFQAIDYWRKMESARVNNKNLFRQIFGQGIAENKPHLIYIVAPLLSFHRDFEFFIECIDPGIKVCRFELNEDWRKQVRVHRRIEY